MNNLSDLNIAPIKKGEASLAQYNSVAYADIEKVLPVTDCIQESFEFPACKRHIVAANFQGGEITSDGGLLLLRRADRLPGGHVAEEIVFGDISSKLPGRFCIKIHRRMT